MLKRYRVLLLLFISTIVFGCSYGPEKPTDLPKLYPVEVSVKFGGKAIENVNVSLIPVDKSKWNAAGSTNSKGIAKLSTSFSFSGVPAGQYIIAFSKNQTIGTAENASTVESEIPLKYSVTQSQETVEIKPQSNKLTFNLDGGSEKKVVNEPTNTGRMPKAM
ncbi:MAG: hypothetical protein LBE12_14290 [Planctomycetaceae bacterium]|jgi:hypothetical protein|nr:hypothetical protein [Planctomycetaceae bacterium]